jgi:AraC-like DNA-binding protein
MPDGKPTPEVTELVTVTHGLQSAPDLDAISPRVVNTSRVRLEILRCRSRSTLHWRASRPNLSLILVRTRTEELQVAISGCPSERLGPRRAKLWFFPEGGGAQGELSGLGPFDCAGICVDPLVVPPAIKALFTQPVSGLAHGRLLRAFDALIEDLKGPEHVVSLITEGWALRALADVARASQKSKQSDQKIAYSLAPWQQRRATELLCADLAENQPLERIAAECRLSASHFARAFKHTMGIPPHQWLTNARINMACDLMLRSALPLAQISSMCGFSDQSHFSRMFSRIEGISPGAWRRQHL